MWGGRGKFGLWRAKREQLFLPFSVVMRKGIPLAPDKPNFTDFSTKVCLLRRRGQKICGSE